MVELKRNLLALVLVMFITLAAAGPVLAYDSDSNIDLLGSGKIPFNAWYAFDKNLAAGKVADVKNNVEQLKYTMLAQWETIAGELSRAQSGFYLDSKYGFKIYSPEVSGKIHVLTLAKAYREAVLAAAGTGDVSGVPYPDLTRTDRSFIPAAELAVSQPAKYVTVEQTVQAIKDIPLPDNLFKGLTFYLLPYDVIKVSDQLGGVSGFHSGRFSGRDEVIYITSLSRDETGGFPPAATTITHEVGHYIHNILLGTYEKYPDRWKPFMDLGGQKNFVQSGSWNLLTEENFAEYFRMTYGNKEASAYPYKASYPAPDAKSISAFKSLVEVNIAREVPGYWDYDSLKITVKGPNGKSIQLGVGPKHGKFASVATAFPEVVLEGSLSTGDARIPCIVFYEQGKISSTDEEFPGVLNGRINYTLKMDKPGKYHLLVGSLDKASPPPDYIGDEGMITVYYTGPAGVAQGGGQAGKFLDTAGHWAQKEIDQMASGGYVNGTGNGIFAPDSPVTRAQFATMMVKALNISGEVQSSFTDVPPGEWYHSGVVRAFAAGLVKGVGASRFAPEEFITREQMSAMMGNALKYRGILTGEAVDEGVLAGFADRESISEWARASASQAVSKGMLKGKPSSGKLNFAPGDQATRAEAAVMLKNLINLLH